MKKLGCLFVSLVIMMCCIAGCSKKEAELSTGIYTWQKSKEPLKPSVTLMEDNKFQFVYSPLSSYIALGTYEIDDDKLLLKTDDNEYTYTFNIKEDTLLFNQKESSKIPSFSSLPDEAVFQ